MTAKKEKNQKNEISEREQVCRDWEFFTDEFLPFMAQWTFAFIDLEKLKDEFIKQKKNILTELKKAKSKGDIEALDGIHWKWNAALEKCFSSISRMSGEVGANYRNHCELEAKHMEQKGFMNDVSTIEEMVNDRLEWLKESDPSEIYDSTLQTIMDRWSGQQWLMNEWHGDLWDFKHHCDNEDAESLVA